MSLFAIDSLIQSIFGLMANIGGALGLCIGGNHWNRIYFVSGSGEDDEGGIKRFLYIYTIHPFYGGEKKILV